ncbi:2,3-diaminopropionate ammonia-lyase (plasmid) [Rhodovastum atsumiense]|uniref:Diaminopropionate ammonia-lyase n=1 Tax=Rhodovastum atsumiense TaxID=504468 RepID=A0A5M6IKC3_9PROT|nr:diaminopropionate ammonia-lyase [Rhodovastum atsumiense]KAA5608008.1 diaminopropionate ammonia-lyase [Rhodovastum atsumiense]CAH2605655.1 2,3-diaminopropionate ammonia-lyase [Rhodovastum atsumiense]
MPSQIEVFLNRTRFYDDPTACVADFSRAQLSKALRFHRTMPGYAPTSLVSLENLAAALGVRSLHVKDESARFGLKAFKVLGGAYAMARHIADLLGRDIDDLPFVELASERIRGEIGTIVFATTTDGNHGRGVAWTARQFRQKAVVYMPRGTTPQRLEAIRAEGAQAEIVDLNYDEAVRMTAREAEAHGWLVVQDTAWPGYEKIPLWIMQGYGTLMLEAMQQLHEVPPTHVLIQAGVGSLAGMVQGMVTAAWGKDRPRVIVVEAAAADCLYRSAVTAGCRPVTVGGDLATVMAGLACGEANTIGWNILRDYAEAFVSCPDFVTTRGMRVLGNPLPGDPAVVSGESGAVTTGLLSILLQSGCWAETREALGLDAQSRVLVVSTEGDTDPQRYRSIVWDGQIPSYQQF